MRLAMSWWSLTFVLFLYSLSFPHQVSAQFLQDYVWQYWQTPAGVLDWPFWRPDSNQQYRTGIRLDPEGVFLEYNCFYMREICYNANQFAITARAQARRYPLVFGYDFDTNRKERRRRRSCPTGWAVANCPEANQQLPMRHDGPWPYTANEPNAVPPRIQNERDAQGNIVRESRISWTCDEFPPATWVEGGSDTTPPGSSLNHGNAFTRCAAARCAANPNGVPVKAEQDWQGLAHGEVRRQIERIVQRRQVNGEFAWWDPTDSFALFGFRLDNQPNMIAAKVYTFNGGVQTGVYDTTQAKRSVHDDSYLRWLNDVSIEELIASGNVTAYHVYANDTSRRDPDSAYHVPNLFKFGLDDGMSFGAVNTTDSSIDKEEDYYDDDDDDDEPALIHSRNSNNPYPINVSGKEPHVPIDPSRARGRFYGRAINGPGSGPLAKTTNSTDLARAQAIVDEALRQSAELNAKRYAHPLRNIYSLAPDKIAGQPKSNLSANARNALDPAPPLLDITDEIADAAALVAEAHAAATSQNVTKRATAASGSYWMEHIDRKGTVPWGNDAGYVIFRNVAAYGAVGDGVTDDTKAIKNAMIDGNRCGEKCNGSTLKNAIVYFPPGKYLVSSTIPMPFGTQVIGDANNWPTILASPSFVGLGVLSADEYTGGKNPDGSDGEYYINTANFYRQVRNLRIDITQTQDAQGIAGIHWQVGQATSLQNIEFIAASGTKQKGIFAENGSGGVMSDLTFQGGAFGIYGGQQQFTTQRMTFDGCATGVQLIWDWSWTWKSITMKNVPVGFRLIPEAPGAGNIGSASIMDSYFTNMDVGVLVDPLNSQPASGSTGIVLENVVFAGVRQPVSDSQGKTLLSASGMVDFWAAGPTYSHSRSWSSGGRVGAYQRQQGLVDSTGYYFERPKPQYQDKGVGDFVHLKDFGAKGDGVTDDTAAFQTALFASQGKIIFVDAGSYILTGTVTIPPGSKLVGETWSQLVASGSYFSDASNPKVMLKVGKVGDIGSVEMQDLLFTTRGPTAGVILVEWNIKADSKGSAALWDCHARIGGATGTQLTPKECPPSTSGTDQGCNAASLMMHITSQASGYFENMWLWVADHMIDDPDLNSPDNDMVQTSIYVARGLLIESQSPTWLYGTASEHSVMYQYNFNGAKNIFAGLIQTESAYYQPNPKPPAPFADVVGKLPGDPDYKCDPNDEFSGCDESWAVIIRKSANIVVSGAGLYSWFSNYAQTCIDSQTCQKAMMLLQNNNAGIRFRNLVTIGAKYMAVEDGKSIQAIDNLNVNGHPRWSQISVLDFNGNGQAVDNASWIDPKIWDMDQPQFSCSPPCVVKIPPWTMATSTVNYPLVTVSQGTWTSTITREPLTIGEVLFEEVTLTGNAGGKLHARADFQPFFPKPATIPYYSPITFNGPNGVQSTITPTAKFPDPPASIGPGAPPPPTGSWPQKAIQPIAAAVYSPLVEPCAFDDWSCLPNPWGYGSNFTTSDPGGDDDDWDGSPDERISCPPIKSTTTTTKKTTTATKTIATFTPHPDLNVVDCFDKGRGADHVRIDNAISSFCRDFATPGKILSKLYTGVISYPFDLQFGELVPLKVELSAEVFGGCSWAYNPDDCKRYLEVPVNSCNCGGVNGKQGGVVSNGCVRFMVDPGDDW